MTTRHILRAGAALALSITALGCGGRSTGEAERLAFTYDSDETFSDLSRPIATGARLSLRVEDLLTATPLPIRSATSDSGALVISGVDDGAATVEALASGSARITVTATLRDQPVTDSLVLVSEPAAHVELTHACAGGESGVYLTGSRIRLPFELTSADGGALIGHGLHPVAFAPEGALSIDESSTSEAFLPLRSSQRAGVVAITSTLDDERLELELIDEAAIEGAELLGGSIDSATRIGETRFSIIAPTYDGRRLCQGEPTREITTLTPSICEVSSITSASEDDPRQGLVSIRGLAQGTCRFTAQYPDAANGAGVVAEFSAPIG